MGRSRNDTLREKHGPRCSTGVRCSSAYPDVNRPGPVLPRSAPTGGSRGLEKTSRGRARAPATTREARGDFIKTRKEARDTRSTGGTEAQRPGEKHVLCKTVPRVVERSSSARPHGGCAGRQLAVGQVRAPSHRRRDAAAPAARRREGIVNRCGHRTRNPSLALEPASGTAVGLDKCDDPQGGRPQRIPPRSARTLQGGDSNFTCTVHTCRDREEWCETPAVSGDCGERHPEGGEGRPREGGRVQGDPDPERGTPHRCRSRGCGTPDTTTWKSASRTHSHRARRHSVTALVRYTERLPLVLNPWRRPAASTSNEAREPSGERPPQT